MSYLLYLQILGAFADRDGVPMQGMKIKNVVPGKNCVSLWNCSGQSIAHMSLDISLFRHSNLASNLFFFSFFLVAFVICGLTLFSKEGCGGGGLLCYILFLCLMWGHRQQLLWRVTFSVHHTRSVANDSLYSLYINSVTER